MITKIVIEGIPHPQPRPAVVRATGRVYYPDKKGRLKAWKAALMAQLVQHKGLVSVPTPIALSLTFVLKRPADHFRGVCETGLKPSFAGTPAVRKPDIDNLVKTVMDVLSDAEVIGHDAWVTRLSAEKAYHVEGEPTGVIISIEAAP